VDVLNVHLSESVESPRIKIEPSSKIIGSAFTYAHSQDGTDENLLILFHGLGDTHLPFTKLGRNLKLPQCAFLSLRAPEKVPFLYEEAYQWYPSFDQLGEILEHPNPSSTLDWLIKVMTHLTNDCKWPPNRIHLFGFSQGGSVASELALRWWRTQKVDKERQPIAFGSVATVSGPLLSYPTISQDARCSSPLLFLHWSNDSQIKADDSRAFTKAFTTVNDIKAPGNGGMPRLQDEWLPVMKFWSEVMGKREMSGTYKVIR